MKKLVTLTLALLIALLALLPAVAEDVPTVRCGVLSMLNVSEEEMAIIDGYLRKYKISNKSRWMRETLLAFIHQNLDKDYPTLFNEHDMRR